MWDGRCLGILCSVNQPLRRGVEDIIVIFLASRGNR